MADLIQLFGVGIETASAQRNVAALNAQMGTMQRTSSALTAGVGKLVAGFATFEVLRRVGGFLFNTTREFEQLEAQLKTVTGTTQQAAQVFRRLEEFTLSTPFELQNLTQAFIRFKALGIEPTTGLLTDFGNIAAAFSRDIVDVARAAQGAVTGETEALKAFGITARIEGERITFAFRGVERTVNRNTTEIINALRQISQENFASAIEDQQKTINTALSNIADNAAKLARTLTGPFRGLMRGFFDETGKAIGHWADQWQRAFDGIARGWENLKAFAVPGGIAELRARRGAAAGLAAAGLPDLLTTDLVDLSRTPQPVTLPHLGPGARMAGFAGQINVDRLFSRLMGGGRGRLGLDRPSTVGRGVALPSAADLMGIPTQEELADIMAGVDKATKDANKSLDEYIRQQELARRGTQQLGAALVTTIGSAFSALIGGGGARGFFGSLTAGIGGIVALSNPVLGAAIGVGGGLLSGLLPDGQDKQRVTVADFEPAARADLQGRTSGRAVTIINVNGQEGARGFSLGDLQSQLREFSRRTGVPLGAPVG